MVCSCTRVKTLDSHSASARIEVKCMLYVPAIRMMERIDNQRTTNRAGIGSLCCILA